MHYKVNYHVVFLCVFFMQMYTLLAIPCDSCGNECASACGTKHFRTCCFNYLRKRTDPNAMKMISNKRLIDFIMLQGRAMYTQNELSHERKKHQLQRQKLYARTMPPIELPPNGTFGFEDYQPYYE